MYKVLIVDDERYICESLIKALKWEQLGFEKPLSALNGEDAVDIIKKHNPDLVITDVKMPKMDGIGLARYINRYYPKINMVFISAYDEFQYARQAIEFGVKSYLLKPVEKDMLKDTVVRVMNLKDFKQDNAVMELDSGDVNTILIRKVQKYILDNFDRRISLSEVAEEMFISPQHLCKKFKKITGMQFVDFVLNVKIKKAKSLIMNSSIKVKDLSIQLGFNDYTYFCKVFKKYEGMSPLQYRAKFVLLDKQPEAASGEDEYE